MSDDQPTTDWAYERTYPEQILDALESIKEAIRDRDPDEDTKEQLQGLRGNLGSIKTELREIQVGLGALFGLLLVAVIHFWK
jgi:hypothetical protein